MFCNCFDIWREDVSLVLTLHSSEKKNQSKITRFRGILTKYIIISGSFEVFVLEWSVFSFSSVGLGIYERDNCTQNV